MPHELNDRQMDENRYNTCEILLQTHDRISVWTESLFPKITSITRLLCNLNNNYGNFCQICSNKTSNSSQDNALSKCHHLVSIFN